jgi:hypothetical protein
MANIWACKSTAALLDEAARGEAWNGQAPPLRQTLSALSGRRHHRCGDLHPDRTGGRHECRTGDFSVISNWCRRLRVCGTVLRRDGVDGSD